MPEPRRRGYVLRIHAIDGRVRRSLGGSSRSLVAGASSRTVRPWARRSLQRHDRIDRAHRSVPDLGFHRDGLLGERWEAILLRPFVASSLQAGSADLDEGIETAEQIPAA